MKKKDYQQFSAQGGSASGGKNKPLPEIQKSLSDYREKLRKLKFDLSQGKVKNISEIKETKKAIARILTSINTRPEKPE